MTEVGIGTSILKDGRNNSVNPSALGYPECIYYDKSECGIVDGYCTHPKHPDNISVAYCSLSNKTDNQICPFDIHEELYGGSK